MYWRCLPIYRLARIPVLAVDFGLWLPPAASSSYIKCVYAVIYICTYMCTIVYMHYTIEVCFSGRMWQEPL